MSLPVNEMSSKGAAKYYASINIIKYTLHGPASDVNDPDKQSKKNGWQKMKCPYPSQDEETPIVSEWRHA